MNIENKEKSSKGVEDIIEKSIVTNETVPAWAQKLIDENAALKDKVTMLTDMAGDNAIASYKDGKKDFKYKTCYLKSFEGKIITSWGKLDLTHYNPRAIDALGENIFIDLVFIDGSKKKVNYIEFVRDNSRNKYEILSENGENLELKSIESGEIISVSKKFINA